MRPLYCLEGPIVAAVIISAILRGIFRSPQPIPLYSSCSLLLTVNLILFRCVYQKALSLEGSTSLRCPPLRFDILVVVKLGGTKNPGTWTPISRATFFATDHETHGAPFLLSS